MPPLALSERQLELVMTAARPFWPVNRDAFLRSVAARLDGIPYPSDGEVERAIEFVLNVYGISSPRVRAS